MSHTVNLNLANCFSQFQIELNFHGKVVNFNFVWQFVTQKTINKTFFAEILVIMQLHLWKLLSWIFGDFCPHQFNLHWDKLVNNFNSLMLKI